ncbi:hypothetical protein AHF37_09782 [Paragonimus kellicotti]|nr:hypothetical protein AHF37_09782 [Paragonimus kellicotti]
MHYRATPNPQTHDGKSPAEALMGRKIRLPLDSIRPNVAVPSSKDAAMEDRFNKRHGVKRRRFNNGQTVLARDYRSGSAKWSLGRIQKIGQRNL